MTFGAIALKQNMIDVCMKTLKSLSSNDATTSNWLNKVYLETKCIQKIIKYNKVSIRNMFVIHLLILFYI